MNTNNVLINKNEIDNTIIIISQKHKKKDLLYRH